MHREVSIFDRQARFLWNSQPALQHTLGKHPWDFVPPQNRSVACEAFCRAAFDDESSEYRTLGLSGKRYVAQLTPIHGAAFALLWREQPAKTIHLTQREQEVLSALLADEPLKATAKRLDCAARTIETHRRNIREKIGAKGMAGVIRWGVSRES